MQIFLSSDIPLSGENVIVPFCLSEQNYSTNTKQATCLTLPSSSTTSLSYTKLPAPSKLADVICNELVQTDQISSATYDTAQGPNVIVETMPYIMSVMDTVVHIEREFSNLVNMPEPELAEDDGYFDYSNW